MNYALYELILRFFAFGEITAEEFLNGLELLSVRCGPAEYYLYNFLDNHDTERFLDLVNGDEDLYLCALAFLMTYKGIPAIFYGDEIGLRGSGTGMEAGRTPMVWDPARWNLKILETTRNLVRLRRSSRALQVGRFLPILFKGRVLAYERVLGEERVTVGINCSEGTSRIPLPGKGELKVPPRSFRILR
jgi:glycosidase